MKKIFLGLFLIFGLTIGLLNVNLKAEGETFTFNYNINKDGTRTSVAYPFGVTYGQTVSIDAGTQVDYEYVGYFKYTGILAVGDYGKVNPVLNVEPSIRVTENTSLDLFYKPSGKVAVILMDANHDYLGVSYTDGASSYLITEPSTSTADPKANLSPVGWTVDGVNLINFASQTFTSDTIITVKYNVTDSTLKTLTITNRTATNVTTGMTDYHFNDVVTVLANGTGTFDYWLKDGVIASIEESYTFTVAKDHVLEAVYDSGFVKDSDLFVGVSGLYTGLNLGYVTLIGQFDLPVGEELVEWGIITSNLDGGITLDTPGVKKINSNKYNPGTNEFVMSFNVSETYPNYRAFVTTVNGSTVKTTYSYLPHNIENITYGSQLFISEYREGATGYDKLIEIYNPTSSAINLSGFNIKINANTNTTWGSAINLVGTINPGETHVIANSKANATILALSDQTSGSLSHNGDDAIGLFNGDTLIDIFGIFGEDPGTGWIVDGITNATADHTIIRKSSSLAPKTVWDTSEWTVMAETNETIDNHVVDYQISYTYEPITSNMIPTSLEITNTVNTVYSGEDLQLTTNISPSSLSDIVWISSNPEYAIVNQSGLVTGVAVGSTTITVYSFYNHSVYDTYTVSVMQGSTTYTVSYNLDGGTNSTSNPANFTVSQLPLELSNPTKEGYTFDGWYLDSGFISRVYSLESEQNYTLYAKWIIENAELTLYQTGWEDGTSQNTYIGTRTLFSNGLSWTFYSGNVVNTGTPISGLLNPFFRYYKDTTDSPYLFMTYDYSNYMISRITFKSKIATGTGAILNIYSKTISGTWVFENSFNLTTTASEYEYVFSNNGIVNIKFEFTYPTSSTSNRDLQLDDISIYGTSYSTEPTEDTTPPEIVLNSYKTSYELNETVILGCTATDNVDPSPICTYSSPTNLDPMVDNTTIGDYDVLYTATDSENNTSTLLVTYTIHAANDYLNMDLFAYYDAAEGLSGLALEAALRTIVSTGFIGVNYGDSRYILDETDQDQLNPDNLILVYRLTSVPGIWDDGITWNREHVWPQSLLGVSVTNTTINEGSDLHNLKPANPSENSSRGNEYYDNMDTSLSYEPPLESKGDVARILFYMVVRYENLELVDTVPTTYQMGLLAVLLSWHELDPVDDFERNRNEVIYSYQNNRNPFIDYPHLVELMFEDHAFYN